MTSLAQPGAPSPAEGIRAWSRRRSLRSGRKLPLRRQLALQGICLLIAFTVMFPILWILSLSVDPRGLSRPDGLNLIPPGMTLDAYRNVIAQPTSNPVSLPELARNSFIVATSTAIVSVGIGVTAAYAFSRLQFRGREVLMLAILGVLMLPAVATIAPLFILLTRIQVGDFVLGRTIAGVVVAVASGALPFAIWNLKGYLDTIPIDLEEAAAVDGASRNQTFLACGPAVGDPGARRDRVPWLHRRAGPSSTSPSSSCPIRSSSRCRWRSTAWSGSSRRQPRGRSSARSRSCSRCRSRSCTSSCRSTSSAASRWVASRAEIERPPGLGRVAGDHIGKPSNRGVRLGGPSWRG